MLFLCVIVGVSFAYDNVFNLYSIYLSKRSSNKSNVTCNIVGLTVFNENRLQWKEPNNVLLSQPDLLNSL